MKKVEKIRLRYVGSIWSSQEGQFVSNDTWETKDGKSIVVESTIDVQPSISCFRSVGKAYDELIVFINANKDTCKVTRDSIKPQENISTLDVKN